MLNQYMTNYSAEEEQQLTDDLIIEAIQARGVDVRYMERTHHNFHFLYGEDPTSSFAGTKSIEMYMANVQGYDNNTELLTKFGFEQNGSATFIVNKTRFKEEFPHLPRPREGDLIFMPMDNSILEIKFVDTESPFFQQGRQFVYEMRVEEFEYSHEEIVASDLNIDALIAGEFNYDPATETDEGGDNADLETEFQPQTIFDPSNPFGVS